MPFGATSGVRLAYVPETVIGTTPATPIFKGLRATGAGFRTNKLTGQSDEIRADRNVTDEFQLGQDVAGSYDIEMSYGSFDDFLEAAMFGTWATDVLKNGITPKSFTCEETIEMGATDVFSRYTGVMVNTLSLNLTARQKITGSIGLMGQKEALASAIVTGATYPVISTEPVLTASAHVAALSVGAFADIKVRSISLQLDNGLRTRPVVGSLYSEEFGVGRFGVTGTIEAYFTSATPYQAVLDHGGGALALTVGAATAKKYTFNMPKMIFLNGEKRLGGIDDDVMLSIPFRAVFDQTLGATLGITRAVA